MNIWLASGNLNKKAELIDILKNCGLGHKLLIPQDAGLIFDPAETGNTFFENALIKSRELNRLLKERHPSPYETGDPIIADDSGLCVDDLEGRPGIFSARYGGKISSKERNALLLEELWDAENRKARFVCSMVLLCANDRFFIAQETLEGEIVKSIDHAAGSGGFGYDPILYIPQSGRTVAQLSEEEKNLISHRGKAGKIIAKILAELI